MRTSRGALLDPCWRQLWVCFWTHQKVLGLLSDMSTLSVNVRYRPVRIGFCIQQGSLDDLDRAIRLTHTFWGGRFNPLIPVSANRDENKLAKALTDVFQVDVLYPVSPGPAVDAFIARFPYLPWPKYERQLYIDSPGGKVASFIDVYHPLRNMFEEHIKDKPEPRVSSTLYEWEQADPLRYVFLATFGAYPSREEIGKDYTDFFISNLKGKRVAIGGSDALPTNSYKMLTPSALSEHDLGWLGFSTRGNPGLYLGEAGSFEDLVTFWNLRAANIELLFYDPASGSRLTALKDAYLAELRSRPAAPVGWLDEIALWTRSMELFKDLDFGLGAHWSVVHDEGLGNGLNVNPRSVYISEQSALASVVNPETRPSLSLQLPPKPFFDDVAFYHQSVVVSLSPIVDLSGQEEFTFKPPHVPEINEYYGLEAQFLRTKARSEPDGLGVITHLTSNHLTMRALQNRGLIANIFRAFGMKAEASQPGLVASRLIKQMGGIQGCRVFKITGVRNLIDKYGPLKSFTRSGAVQIIGQNDSGTHRPNFSNFENLFIEQREQPRLTPQQTFRYLVRKGVFRAGLKLACPHCQLDPWIALDDIGTEVKCELCDGIFGIADQLHDRDWAYRRSGLFGREDHQEGGVPVVLTLQQMDTTLSDMIYTTAMKISPITASVLPCETDFVLVGRGTYELKIPLAIGECKAGQEISEQDVQNLGRVADAFAGTRIEPFIIFAKATSFTPEEVALCRAAQGRRHLRVILLSARELEPYFVYERTATEFEIRSTAVSLEDLARATQNIYFRPIPKAQRKVPTERSPD
jgi:hypothetical protein